MKTKKPARIKGEITVGPLTGRKWITVPIDNPDALLGQVAEAIRKSDWQSWNGRASYDDFARAALRSIGVPLKKAK